MGLVTAASDAVAQQPALAQIDLKDIAAVCSGLQTATASGGRGKISTGNGYEFEVTADKELKVTQSGQLISKIDKFTYQDYAKCVSDLAVALTRPVAPQEKACRDPSHGVERYAREFDVTRESPEMGGGHSQPEWCNNLMGTLRGEQPLGQFSVVSSGEHTNNHCAPFNCPQYVYSCTIHVKTDPIWIEKISSACK
jgi:hypothetical protein